MGMPLCQWSSYADWGVTQALVAEGLSLDVATHAGGVDEGALLIIESQFEALEFLVDVARNERPLTISLIRQLHAALCRAQLTFTARSSQGQIVDRP
jgi:hypothetical protein